jgi:hypothetical protein
MPKIVRFFRLDADVIESYKCNTAQFEGLKLSRNLHVSISKKCTKNNVGSGWLIAP